MVFLLFNFIYIYIYFKALARLRLAPPVAQGCGLWERRDATHRHLNMTMVSVKKMLVFFSLLLFVVFAVCRGIVLNRRL